MQQIHITPDGPKPCTAEVRACKYGNHTTSWKEAEAMFAAEMGGEVATVTKTKHVFPQELLKNRPTVALSPEKRQHLAAANLPTPVMRELDAKEAAPAFSDAITASAKGHKYGASVYVYPVEEYEQMRLFVSEDGSTGFAIKDDGDIVSVYTAQDSPHKGAAYNNILTAVENGGTKLDCFDTVLPKIYNRCGFEEYERFQWDDQYMPDGWDKETYKKFNNGEPDVVMMKYTGFDPKKLTS